MESLSWEDGDGLRQALLDLEWAEEARPQLAVKVTTLPSRLKEFLETVVSPMGSSFTGGLVADMGCGQARLLWWDLPQAGVSAGVGVEGLISSLRERARPHTGNVVVERCPLEVKANLDVWDEVGEAAPIMRRIKQELDPAGILNPGRFAGGI